MAEPIIIVLVVGFGFVLSVIQCEDTIKVDLYWSKREGDIAWNGCIYFPVMCLHLVAAKIKEIFAFAPI